MLRKFLNQGSFRRGDLCAEIPDPGYEFWKGVRPSNAAPVSLFSSRRDLEFPVQRRWVCVRGPRRGPAREGVVSSVLGRSFAKTLVLPTWLSNAMEPREPASHGGRPPIRSPGGVASAAFWHSVHLFHPSVCSRRVTTLPITNRQHEDRDVHRLI